MNKPKVSILCHCFNHEKYIAKALDSFIMQKTKYDFEICIHDDASTDNTAYIIREYQNKYPQLFKVILQDENQYSKGKSVNMLNFQQSSGEYIAFCEGDDYWTDIYKLEKQIDILERFNEVSLVAHAYKSFNQNTKIRRNHYYQRNNGFVDQSSVIKSFNPIFHFNSLMVRRGVMLMPDFYIKLRTADSIITHHVVTLGRIYYLAEVMSVYRTGVKNSWSDRLAKDPQILYKTYQLKRDFLEQYNIETKYEFNSYITKHIEFIDTYIKKDMTFKEYYSKINYKTKTHRLFLIVEYFSPKYSTLIRHLLIKYFY